MIQRWEIRQKQKFQHFVQEVIGENELDYIFLLERKGKLFDFLELIPEDFHGYIGYDWTADLIPPSALENRHIGIFDDVVRHGTQLEIISQRLQKRSNGKAYVYPIALFGPKDDKDLSPGIEYKEYIDEKRRTQVIANITNYLLSKGKPLDIDHPLIQVKLKLNGQKFDYEEFSRYLSTLGNVFSIPTLPRHEYTMITLDSPLFFDILNNKKNPPLIEREGVVKIRFYINKDDGTWYVVPIVYPKALINLEKYASSCEGVRGYKVPFCKILPDYESLDKKTKVKCCYKCITLNLALTLIQKFLEKFESFLRLRNYLSPELEVLKKDLVWYYGPEISKNIASVFDGYIKNLPKTSVDLFSYISRSDNNQMIEDKSKQYIEDCLLIFKEFDSSLRDEQGRLNEKDLSKGLPFTEIKKRNTTLKNMEISKALDILLDLGALKPLDVIKDDGRIVFEEEEIIENKTYECARAYRIGESGEKKGARPDDYLRVRTVKAIPNLLSRISEINKLKGRVPSLKGNKSIILLDKLYPELQLDLDIRRDLYGNRVDGAKERHTLPKRTLDQLAEDSDSFEIDHTIKPNIFILKYTPDLTDYLEKDTNMHHDFYNWVDLIAHLYPLNIIVNNTERHYLDALTTLSTCYNEDETYKAAFYDIKEWKQRLFVLLDYIKSNKDSLATDKIEEGIDKRADKVAKAHHELGNKLLRFETLGQLKERIERKKVNWPFGLKSYIEDLYDIIEIPEGETYRLKHLKISFDAIRAFTNLIRNCLSTMGYVPLQEDTTKKLNDYLEDFSKQFDEEELISLKEEEKKDFIEKINQKDIEFFLQWFDGVYRTIGKKIIFPLVIYGELPPKEYKKRVFIGIANKEKAKINEICGIINKNKLKPIVVENKFVIPKEEAYDGCVEIMKRCYYALFEISSGQGQFMEMANFTASDLIKHCEGKGLMVYDTDHPSEMALSSGLSKRKYTDFTELDNILSEWFIVTKREEE